jgi:hypothetical protein
MPSEAHLDLQHRAVKWLGNKATKRGVRAGFEIQVAQGYVADVVALLSFQYRHAVAYGLIERRQRTYDEVDMAVRGVEPACVFEAKAGRADFLSTFGPSATTYNRFYPKADLHWVVAAKGVAEPEDLPGFWGLLVASGCGLREVKPPVFQRATEDSRLRLARELLWRGCEARPEKALARGWWRERRRLRDALGFYAEDGPDDCGRRARDALAE